MAETRTINLEIKDNFKKVEKDIDDLNESLKETEKIVSKTSGVDKFTARLDELDAQIASGNLNTRQMNKLLQEYQTVAAQAGTQTPIGDRAIKSAAGLKDTLTDLQVRTKLLSSDYVKMDTTLAAIGTGAQAFSGIQSAMVLTGVESEELQKTMVKLQAVQGVSNSISAVTNALNKDAILGIQARIAIEKIQAVVIGTTTGAMKLLRIALISTGIGALVVSVGLLVANFDKLLKVFAPVIDNLKKSAAKLLNLFTPVIDGLKNFYDAIGLTDFAGEERAANEKKRYEAELKQIEKLQEAYEQKIIAQRKYFENVKKAYEISKTVAESEINLLESQGKSSIALRKEQALLEVQNAKKLLQQKQEAANVLGLNNAYAQRLGINKKLTQSEQDILAAKTALNTAEASLNKLNKEGSEKAKQAAQDARNLRRQIQDEQIKGIDDLNQKEQTQLIVSAQRRIEDLSLTAKDKKKNAKLITEIQNNLNKDLEKLDEKFYEAQRKAQEEAQKLANSNKIRLQREFDNIIEALAEQNFQNTLTEEQREIQAVNDKYFELQTLAAGNAEQLAIIEQAKADELGAIEKKANEKSVEEARAVAEQKAAIQQQGLDTALQGVQLIKGLFEKSKGVQKAAVIAESAIGIAKMIISNKLANAGALATPQAIATSGAAAVPVIALNNISTGIGIAANIAATAKALKSLGGGSAPSAPPDGGGGGGGGASTTPQFNTIGSSGVNQLAQLQQQPVQAYVVSGDVTSAQSLDRNRIQNATL
jgi:hypothetical protein